MAGNNNSNCCVVENRRKGPVWRCLPTTLVMILVVPLAFAHPGRTDRYGGHYVRTPGWGYPVGSYHYHNGGYGVPRYSIQGFDLCPQATYYTRYSRNQIKMLQNRLRELGYYLGAVDGVVGPLTVISVIAFQSAYGLTPDGYAGPITFRALGLDLVSAEESQAQVTHSASSKLKSEKTSLSAVNFEALLDRELEQIEKSREQIRPSSGTITVYRGPGIAENGSYYGQISPVTGRPKTVYVRGYYRKDGTYVRSHYRSSRK